MEKIIQHAFPLYFAAPVSWYFRIFEQEEILLKNDFRFVKQTYRHKLNYMTIEGPKIFSIPLLKHTRNHSYRSVEICYQTHWQNQLINALRTSYGKSPFFEYYDYRFEQIISEKYQYLWDLNFRILEETLSCLKVNKKLDIFNSEAYNPDPLFEKFPEKYYQVFGDKIGFVEEMSILDLIFNEGINAINIFTMKKYLYLGPAE